MAGLRAAKALGIKRLVVKGDSQLVINQSNKDYKAKDPRMAAYLAVVRKMEKHFLGIRFKHIPRLDNHDTDDIAKKSAKREPLLPGVFAERLIEPSVKIVEQVEEALDQSLDGAGRRRTPTSVPDSAASLNDRALLALSRPPPEWIVEIKKILDQENPP